MSFNFLMQTDCEVFDFHCTFCRKLQSYRLNHRSFPFMCILYIWCFLLTIYCLFGFSKTFQQLDGPYIHTQVNAIADHYQYNIQHSHGTGKATYLGTTWKVCACPNHSNDELQFLMLTYNIRLGFCCQLPIQQKQKERKGNMPFKSGGNTHCSSFQN